MISMTINKLLVDNEALSAAVRVGGIPRMHTKAIIMAYLEALSNKQSDGCKFCAEGVGKCPLHGIKSVGQEPIQRTQNTEDKWGEWCEVKCPDTGMLFEQRVTFHKNSFDVESRVKGDNPPDMMRPGVVIGSKTPANPPAKPPMP